MDFNNDNYCNFLSAISIIHIFIHFESTCSFCNGICLSAYWFLLAISNCEFYILRYWIFFIILMFLRFFCDVAIKNTMVFLGIICESVRRNYFYIIIIVVIVLRQSFSHVALTVLKVTKQSKVSSNSQKFMLPEDVSAS